MSKKLIFLLFVLVFIGSVTLGVHNALLYNPLRGFDGSGHIEYVKYLYDNRQIPPPTGLETHQSPLYYIISAVVLTATQQMKSIQFVNIFVLWLIISIVGYFIYHRSKDLFQTLIGVTSLAALPMLNIFQPMVTNELLNTFWIISSVVFGSLLIHTKEKIKFNKYFLLLLVSLVLGVWTKITIISVIPTVILAIFLATKTNLKKFFALASISLFIFAIAYLPIYLRASKSSSPSNVALVASHLDTSRSLDFYYRLDWIPKVDMYTTQYYSFLGGAWNSFWSDGHNVITPFVPFHKKAFILWSLGFVLLPLSLFGLYLQFKRDKKTVLVMLALNASMIAFYFLYNMVSNHYSAVRLTYEMGIVLPYAYGLSSVAQIKKLRIVLLALLLVQFAVLLSFYWILPWWYQAQP